MPLTKISETVSDFAFGDDFKYLGALGLTVTISGGIVTDNRFVFEITDNTVVTVPDDSVTRIVVTFDEGLVTTEANASSFSYLALYDITTVAGQVTVVNDLRSEEVSKVLVQVAPSGLVLSPYYKKVLEKSPYIYHTFTAGEVDLDNRTISQHGGTEMVAPIMGDASLVSKVAGPGGIAIDAIELDYTTSATTAEPGIGLPNLMWDSMDTAFRSFGMISVWFKTSSLGTGATYVMSQRQFFETGIFSLIAFIDDGSLSCRVFNGSSNEFLTSAPGSVSIDTWHHVVIKEESDAALTTLWLDGVLVDTASITTWDANAWISPRGFWTLGNTTWSQDEDNNGSTTGGDPGIFGNYSLVTPQNTRLAISSFSMHAEKFWTDAEILEAYNLGIGA